MKKKDLATLFAMMAAALYAVNVPLSKLLLRKVSPVMMAAFLYLGAGIGMMATLAVKKRRGTQIERLTKKELPYTLAMILLDIAAPILLMLGIMRTNAANVSLLNNFEIVVTSLIALLVFREKISRRLWISISLISLASAILTFEGKGSFVFNRGSMLVLGACICWGFENNCTKMISNKSSEEIVVIKGCFSGLGALLTAFFMGEILPSLLAVAGALVLGFVSYGLSINLYIKAQKDLGAAKTSAYYSIAPFLGVLFSILLIGERPLLNFYIALCIMVATTFLMIKDSIGLQHNHLHAHIHSHAHPHGDWIHTHEHLHEHSHWHIHGDEESHEHGHDEEEEHHGHVHEDGY
ncbi:MAG: EamA family transporter [Peptostreptococcaceae bacterium]|nr:EamA family transporter [Peptostreptococcaceae bacterium]